MKWWAAVLWTCVAGFSCLVLYDFHRLIGDVRVSIRESDYVLGNINEVAQNANGVVDLAHGAVQKISEAATEETKSARKISLETYKTMASVRLLVVRLDNGPVSKLNAVLESADKNLDELSQAIASTNKLAADADAQISDPAIKNSLDKLNISAQNLADATKDGAATMVKLRDGVTDFFKPISKAKQVLYFVATLVGKFVGF